MVEIYDHDGNAVKHGRQRANGIRLHYVTAGSGEPLLLLQGTPKTHYFSGTQRVLVRDLGKPLSAQVPADFARCHVGGPMRGLSGRTGHMRRENEVRSLEEPGAFGQRLFIVDIRSRDPEMSRFERVA